MKIKIGAIILLFACCNSVMAQQWEWGYNVEQTNGAQGVKSATDAFGNVYCVGYFNGQIIFGTDTFISSINTSDLFVTKNDRFGNIIWAKRGRGDFQEYANDIDVDGNGNVTVTGNFSSYAFYFENDSLTNPNPPIYRPIILRLNSSGNLLWMKTGVGYGYNNATEIATDNNNDIYIAGYFHSISFSIDSFNINNSGSGGTADIFFAKFTSSGTLLWLKDIGGASGDYPADLNCDNLNNIYLCGNFSSHFFLIDTVQVIGADTVGADYDFFLSRFNNSGNIIWVKTGGGIADDSYNCIATDEIGNIYVGGEFISPQLIIGNDTFQNASVQSNWKDALLVRYDTNGNLIWAKQGAGEGSDFFSDLSIDQFQNLYAVGNFARTDSSSIEFDSLIIEPPINSSYPAFTALFNSDGGIICHHVINYAGKDAISISTNNFQDVFVCSDFYGPLLTLDSIIILPNPNYSTFFIAAFKQCIECEIDTSATIINASICKGEIYVLPSGNIVSDAGIYHDTINSFVSCDSLVTTNLTVTDINAHWVTNWVTIQAIPSGGSYLWLDCNNNFTPISGATNQTFSLTTSGAYAVIVTMQGCSDTSGCFFYNGVTEPDFSNVISIYPNPSTDQITVSSNQIQSNNYTLSITDVFGKVLIHKTTDSKSQTINIQKLSAGVYFLSIKTTDGESFYGKFVKL